MLPGRTGSVLEAETVDSSAEVGVRTVVAELCLWYLGKGVLDAVDIDWDLLACGESDKVAVAEARCLVLVTETDSVRGTP